MSKSRMVNQLMADLYQISEGEDECEAIYGWLKAEYGRGFAAYLRAYISTLETHRSGSAGDRSCVAQSPERRSTGTHPLREYTMSNRQPSIGTMSGEEFNLALGMNGQTAAAAAVFFGVNERSVYRWRSPDDVGPPESVAMWARYMAATNVSPEAIARLLEEHYPEHYAGLVEQMRTARARQSKRRREPEPA